MNFSSLFSIRAWEELQAVSHSLGRYCDSVGDGEVEGVELTLSSCC